jgi:catechol 2,3-dioxygenase-like lactoylglutathione lyase family enzyme
MRINQLNHVAIHVEDVERSCRFYADVLGLEALPRPAFSFPGAWFRLGPGQELHIIGERGEQPFAQERANHFALRVESVLDAEAALNNTGTEFMGPRRRPDGAWQIFLTDPDDHWIELCELPA